ncbi:PKD domain-containing protein [Catalinimonas niigatensis]|uniref:PKD domain-containing protein n=1 Tax=Catalinimonas niigatensis TaxID=1397264 RepID=UPI0026660E0F|nr:PKD domain-containing protein [Catalinimonas niigatensis]WPP50577.1 PKD domain-containing protein [Catalinimonas niigatensis]
MKNTFTIDKISGIHSDFFRKWVCIFLLASSLIYQHNTFAQCSNASNPGNNVESPPQLCAPHDFEWKVWYTVLGSPSSVEFEFIWGDEVTPGTSQIIPAIHVGSGKYEVIVPHQYKRDGEECNYNAIVYLRVNGTRCTSAFQTQNVTVWDIDNENGGRLRINPEVYRICVGDGANIRFTDNTTFNCVPASGENDRINNPVRWIQWIYGTGPVENRLANVEVNGALHTYDYEGPVEVLPGPVVASGKQSYNIQVPFTTAADLGKQFEVTLRNWNICNPYDADTTDGNYLNPLDPDGDSNYISRTARIIVVEKSAPQFRTRLDNSSGNLQSDFCISDQVYFENRTPDIADADLRWVWEFYDDDTETTLLQTKTGKHPTFTYTTPGRKAIRLTANDRNSVGNCGGTILKYINVLATPNATLDVTETNDDPLSDLCIDPINPQSIEIRFHDVSSNYDNANSTWAWNFYDPSGTLIENISGSGIQGSIDRTFDTPGTYAAELISSTTGVDCETRDTAYVHIYEVPNVDFSTDEVCATDSTTFESLASLSLSVNGDQIDTYEWDFDYDGVTFDVEATTDTDPFKHKFSTSGTFQVAHRVSTQKGSCSALIVKSVTVKPLPDVSFTADQVQGCSPLQVAFTPNTLLANQPTTINSYIWYVRDLRTNVVTNNIINPALDTFNTSFINDQPSFINHTYEVWLEAKSANSCDVTSDTITITVFPGPPSDFSVTNLNGLDTNCSPRAYDFKVNAATRSLNPDLYHWEILDLSDSSLVNDTTIAGTQNEFSYVLTNQTKIRKKFSVKLLAEKGGLCFSETEKILDVNPVPTADFSYEIIEADCESVVYKITAQEEGLFYDWQISPAPLNNPDLTERSIEVHYQKSSISAYDIRVTLLAENIVGCVSDANIQSIQIDPQENIGASFDVSPTILEIPEKTVTITNNTNPGAWTYFWDFGDGNTSSEKDPLPHTYEKHGEYMIKMRAEGLFCYEEDSAMVIIKQTLPQIDFSFSSIEGCLPLEVTFTNESLYADSSTFLWDLGDGTVTTELHPSHTYTESGIYTISLQASNELGVVMQKKIDLIVDLDKGPQADFRIRLAQSYLPGQEINFFNQSQRSEFYFWDFGDGSTSTESEPKHVYNKVGHYEIMLVTSNALGCTDTLTKPIFIEPFHPEVDFTYEPPTGCRPLTVQFRNLSRFAEPGTYRWSFGKGEGVSTEENPSYTYYEPGMYTVTLEATNSNGVTSRAVKEFSVEVYETPRASFNLRPQEAFLSEPIYFVNLSVDAKNYYWDFGDGNVSTEYEPSHVYQATGTYDVTLVAESEKGCTDTLTLVSAVIIKNGGKVNIPNAFTPNTMGPGGSDAGSANKNDVFLPVFEGVTDFHMMIYNRWGELLFESVDKTYGWDGYYKGRLCPKDVYVYKLALEFSNGKSKSIVGDLTLVR